MGMAAQVGQSHQQLGTFGSEKNNSIEFVAKRSPEASSPYDFGLIGGTHIQHAESVDSHEEEFDRIISRMRRFFNENQS